MAFQTLAHLFTDHRFWVLLLTNWVGISLSALLIYFCLTLILKKDFGVTQQLKAAPVWIFFIAIIYQFLRHAEYAIQFFRQNFMELPVALYVFQSPWTPFFLTLVYFTALVIATKGLIKALDVTDVLMKPVNLMLLAILLILPAWHVAEYIARIIRYIKNDCVMCPGVLDELLGVEVISVDFWLGSLTLSLSLAVFLWYGFDWKLKEHIKHIFFCLTPGK